jgi:hypothetical protein
MNDESFGDLPPQPQNRIKHHHPKISTVSTLGVTLVIKSGSCTVDCGDHLSNPYVAKKQSFILLYFTQLNFLLNAFSESLVTAFYRFKLIIFTGDSATF